MEGFLKKTGWISILTSVVFAILGIIMIANPETTANVILTILGAVFIVIGIIKIINYFLARGTIYKYFNYDLIYGIIAIAIGLVSILFENTLQIVFAVIAGLWIIYSGLLRIQLSLKLKSLNLKIWSIVLLMAMVIIVCGIYLAFNSTTLIIAIGIVIVIYAILDLIEGIVFVKNVDEILK